MIRPILKYPDTALEKVCEDVSEFDQELESLAGDMLETMYAAPGVGLAAPQIGVLKRLVVVDPTAGQEEGHKLIIVNPAIVEKEGRQKEEEGCLSIPGLTAVVERPWRVIVRGQNLDGSELEVEAEDILSRVLCHEIDHLNGVLYLDRVSAIKRDLLKRKIKKLIRNGEW